jgi:hypothetical protein
MSTASLGVRAVIALLVVAFAGCATVQQPQRGNLGSDNVEIRECARWFDSLDSAVARAGVADVQARRIDGFPYLRADRFTAAIGESADADAGLRNAWIERMRELDAIGRRVEITNLPAADVEQLGVGDRSAAVSRSQDCAQTLARADMSDSSKVAGLLEQRVGIDDDYSSLKRTFGLYALLKVPFAGGIEDWHEEAVQEFQGSRAGERTGNPLIRYVPPAAPVYTRAQVAEVLNRTSNPLGVPVLSKDERDRLFATYAPVLEVETTGDFDRIGKLFWSAGPAPEVDVSQPTVYRKLAYTRVEGRTLVQLVYVAWMPERPKDDRYDMLGGLLDGIIWRVTLAADGEPIVFDTIHPCGCFHMFFPTPRVEPVPAPDKYEEWAFSPAGLPTIAEGTRLTVSAQTRTHYLSNVWPTRSSEGTQYVFADYDELRTLPLPAGGSRSAFGPDGLVPGTERGEAYLFWPMGIASAGAMRQWGTHATAFLGRRHFDDADLIEKRFRLVE